MANSWFEFKQFRVEQGLSAMKVGTDGVLLGAWAKVNNAKHILDIGTGTGLIALMLAQRNSNARIDALEIDKSASKQASQNFENSNWKNSLSIINNAVQNYNPENKYDCIVSNPPFFENSYSAKGKERNIARQTESLSFPDLLIAVKRLLRKEGRFSVILPKQSLANFIQLAGKQSLFLNKITNVYPTKHSEIKRVLLEFSFIDKVLEEDNLVIEPEKRHQYSAEYIKLTKEFYLKM